MCVYVYNVYIAIRTLLKFSAFLAYTALSPIVLMPNSVISWSVSKVIVGIYICKYIGYDYYAFMQSHAW